MPKKKKSRKKAYCGFILAILMPILAKAQSVNLDISYTASPIGSASQQAAVLYGIELSPNSYTAQIARQVAVDSNGQLKTTGSGGNVSITGGTINAYITGTVSVLDSLLYGYITKTASGAAATGGSITAIALTGTVLTNITTAAGADVPCIVTIEGGAGPNAGLYWGILPSSTWVAPVTYLAVSTTPIQVTVGRGDHLQLSATAAAVTVNARVRYAPIQ